MNIVWIIVIVIIVVLLMYVALTYNSLVKLRNIVKDQWAQVDVLLKRRVDLIPNLVETVKGYAKHERETLEAVMNARSKALNATNPTDEMQANGELSQALGRLLSITEAYPDLKANENFNNLQTQLKETEDKVAFSRQFYNDSVMKYKNKIEMFPSNIIANMFGFKAEPFFEVTNEDERKAPQVKF